MDELIDRIRRGDRSSLARAMSVVDGDGDEQRKLADRLRQSTGDVPWWGVTGPPGVGKSTLIDALVGMLRESGRRVGIVAVDPTSPLSKGALLGDRVRMMRHAVDEGVFIRSLATHGSDGGLSDAAVHCARLLELAKYDPVLIETVGVGQNQVDIAWAADICVVVLGPGYGDGIQLIKAGLLEIADLVAVNKCDLPDANRLVQEVREELGAGLGAKSVDIISVEARSSKGVDRLLQKLLELDACARGEEQRLRRRHRLIVGEVRRSTMLTYERALERKLDGHEAENLVAKIERGELTVDSVIAQLASAVLTEQCDQPGGPGR